MNALRVGPPRALNARGLWAGGLLLAITAFVIFAGPRPAAASTVQCAGDLTVPKGSTSKVELDYEFFCDEEVLAYTIGFSKSIDSFEPEVLPLLADGVTPAGELAFCEGFFPGAGIGCTAQSSKCPSSTSTSTSCTGVIGAGNRVISPIETSKPYCGIKQPRKRPFTATLTVTTRQATASGKTFITSSQPFNLDRVKCPAPEAKS